MKFLKINAKVLLILCLFSGILFLSTGCGDNTDAGTSNNDDKDIISDVSDDKKDNQDKNETPDNPIGDGSLAINDEVDYSVWVANTTINTDKTKESYKVIWGDTLWLISTAWEVSYQEIATFNNIENPDLIYVDQIIYNPLFK